MTAERWPERDPERAGRPGPRVVLLTVSVTCLTDGLAHLVTDVQLAAGTDRTGRYLAVCGHVVVAGSLVEPEGRACPLCAEGDRPGRPRRRRR